MTIMIKGERYQRGVNYGEPVGPVFVVESGMVEGDHAKLRATTTLTGWVLTATTKNIPDGWIGPLTDQHVAYQEHRQLMRGGRRS